MRDMSEIKRLYTEKIFVCLKREQILLKLLEFQQKYQ